MIFQKCQLRKPLIHMKKLHGAKARGAAKLRGGENGINHVQVALGAPRRAALSPPGGAKRTSGSSLTFGAGWSGGPFQTPVPGPSWLPHGACPARKPIFPGGPRGPGSALRCLRVRWGHLGQEVGKFGYGGGNRESDREGRIRR